MEGITGKINDRPTRNCFWVGHGFKPCRLEHKITRALASEVHKKGAAISGCALVLSLRPQNKNFNPICNCREEPESPFGKRVFRITPNAPLGVPVGEVSDDAVRLCGFPKFG